MMGNGHGKYKGDSGKSVAAPKPPVPADAARADEVERVLEHVSSSFRWELLESQNTLPKNVAPTDTSRHK
ncbi:MAG TPA: hypothetical protein PLU16_07620 [Gallionellaceae bacterium]|nr:MAG: hypothetical protein B7Y04_03685 [Gallionellales bacterium 24-53-125]HQS58724.1 hypothetical protein [Gallionellaceae bacterium]HQS75064.1 hypothetical protein [Gallionellaceae bacterium]